MYIEQLNKSEEFIKYFVESYLGYTFNGCKFGKISTGEQVVRVSILIEGVNKPLNYEFSDYTVKALKSGARNVSKKFEASIEADWRKYLDFKFSNYSIKLNRWLDGQKLESYDEDKKST